VRGATATIRNSLGQVAVGTTDGEGKYALDPMPLNGTDKDTITFEAEGLVGLRLGPLHFNPQTDKVEKPGATILLPKQRVMHVVVH
jgi:hypothetical protein